ncbi:hypothetical protein MTR67_022441 [Solanum verrucosum]|uniref:RNase H type-1 domain-containing protein n=1 Tax=Solanum verrucosum TaxID=315347 RepID=A0AAF0QTE4_SOLVR|nr:hypothetical protein MTR67_022441 [Solanum verrucosum]
MPLVRETDSLIIKKVLDGIWEIPWSIAVEIRVIKRAMENGTTMIEHTCREGNKLADFLTNYVFSFAGIDQMQFNFNQELLQQANIIYN